MSEKKRFRFMNVSICCCLIFTALMVIACYVAAWFGIDTDSVLTHTCAVFGGELVLTLLIKLLEKDEPKDKKKEGNG